MKINQDIKNIPSTEEILRKEKNFNDAVTCAICSVGFSSATASIYTFAAFLYAAKAMEVEDEKLRDAYWTNLAYFGSMRELGQAATWFIADIKEHLEVIYRNRYNLYIIK